VTSNRFVQNLTWNLLALSRMCYLFTYTPEGMPTLIRVQVGNFTTIDHTLSMVYNHHSLPSLKAWGLKHRLPLICSIIWLRLTKTRWIHALVLECAPCMYIVPIIKEMPRICRVGESSLFAWSKKMSPRLRSSLTQSLTHPHDFHYDNVLQDHFYTSIKFLSVLCTNARHWSNKITHTKWK
jgi:hypothetical protein